MSGCFFLKHGVYCPLHRRGCNVVCRLHV